MPWVKQFDVDEVLDKAMHRFWQHGYQATSIQDLVECTGVHRASLYGTYGDKHDLFVAALERYDREHRQRFLQGLEQGHSPREAIRHAFLAFSEPGTADGSGLGCLMTNSALELSPHDPEVRRIVARAQFGIESFFRRMIERGQDEGEVPVGLDPRSTARGLTSSFLGLIVLSRSRPERALLRSVAEEAVRRIT